jgi:hypothetical protein
MTQQARDVGEFGLWVDHFEQNVSVHATVTDEHPHVRFQQDRLRAGFRESGIPLPLLAFAFWWLTAIGDRRTQFVRDVLADFCEGSGRRSPTTDHSSAERQHLMTFGKHGY